MLSQSPTSNMVKQRQMTKSKNDKRRVERQAKGLRLPSRFPRPADDVVSARIRFSYALVAATGAPFTTTKIIALGNGTNTGDYVFLNSLSSVFAAYSAIYSRFVVTQLRAALKTTGIGTGNALAAVNYTPGNTGFSNPPTVLSDVAQAVHFCDATMGSPGAFMVDASEYFNDWRQTIDADNSDAQAGVLKVYGVGSSGASSIGILDVEMLVHFCGLRIIDA